MQRLENDMTVLKRQHEGSNETIETIAIEVHALREDVTTLHEDVTTLRADVDILKTDVSVLKTDVAVLKTDMQSVKANIAEIKQNMVPRNEMTRLKEWLDDQFAENKAQHAATMAHLARHDTQFNEIKVQLAELKALIKQR